MKKYFPVILLLISIFNAISPVFAKEYCVPEYYDLPAAPADEAPKKHVAITFDDGPHPVYTAKILDILEKTKTPATFFIVGFRAALHTNLLARMHNIGCELANHTFSHIDLSLTYKAKILNELTLCDNEIKKATGSVSALYRPPFGRIKKYDEKYIDKQKILWNIDSRDWRSCDKDSIISRVTKNLRDGGIILMHDFYQTTVDALPEIIEKIKEAGFEPVTVSEILKYRNK